MRAIPLHVRQAIYAGDHEALSKMGRKGGKAKKSPRPSRRPTGVSPGVKPAYDPEIAKLLEKEREQLGEDD